MKKQVLFLTLLLATISLSSQEKKNLTHKDYDLWKRLENIQFSPEGAVVATTVATTTKRGDGYLQIYDTKNQKKYQYFNGTAPQITFDENYVVFLEKPAYAVQRKERKEEIKKENKTKNKLFVFDVRKGNLIDSFQNVKSFSIPKEHSDFFVIEHFKIKKEEKDSTKNSKKANDSLKYKDAIYKNNFALIYHFKTKQIDTLRDIKDFALAEKKPALFYSKTKGEKNGDRGIYTFDFSTATEQPIDTGKYTYDKITLNKTGDCMSYLAAPDSTSTDSLQYQLYLYHGQRLTKITDSLGKNLRHKWQVNGTNKPYFSENTKRLYFYTTPKKQYDIDTALLKDEFPEVDVWHYQDKKIQPEQKVRLKELKNKGFLSYWDLGKHSVMHLQNTELDTIILDKNKEQEYVLGYTSQAYELEKSWHSPRKLDIYSVNTKTGEKRLAVKAIGSRPYLAIIPNYALYFEPEKGNWWSVNLETLKKQNLTATLPVPFYDVDDDHPMLPEAYGFGGFDEGGSALLYDQFDIWKVNFQGNTKPVNITKTGRKDSIVYRALRLNEEYRQNVSYYNGDLLLSAFDKKDKTGKLYKLDNKTLKKKALATPKGMFLSNFIKAKNAEKLLYRKQNFTTYPDLYLLKDKGEDIQITAANTQQKNFQWGTVALFQWAAFDGTALEGLLYKPENFDAQKKYPVIIYFYEKYADRLHRYYTPQPSASIVNMSYLVSNDYLVFVPDIVYKEGHPGESAYNCIVSGAEAIKKLPYVDAENMAIQGQSWGGYQVAYLVTRTNMFKAAMAGAPVSNMTSAYGGIRWKSGLSREFQYEKTQSRIGKTLWDGFDLYVENSPLFGIPKIETPLLMMHNDEDGAVPYYQGIEMFMGMRRLRKPAWLLVYNNEQHNLKKMKNKQDLSIRMMQFFDHYLKGTPAPQWMKKGLPAVNKGKDLGYEVE